jgi:hypothetical protein
MVNVLEALTGVGVADDTEVLETGIVRADHGQSPIRIVGRNVAGRRLVGHGVGSSHEGMKGARARLARPEPRLRGRPGDRRVIEAREVPVDGARDRRASAGALRPDPLRGMVGLAVDTPSGGRRIDCFLKVDRQARKDGAKFAAYDAFITAWSVPTSRYQKVADPPVVVFVCEDQPLARAFVPAADEQVTGRLITLKAPADQWAFPGRERMYFCCDRDIHEGGLRAWQLPRFRLTVASSSVRSAPAPQPAQLIAAEVIGRARRPNPWGQLGSRATAVREVPDLAARMGRAPRAAAGFARC